MPSFSPVRWFTIRAAALRSQRTLAVVIGTLIFAICVADITLVLYLRNQAFAFGQRETRNLAYALSEQTDKALQSVQLITSVVAERIQSRRPNTVQDFEELVGGPYIRELLQGSISKFGQLDDLSISSARGTLLLRGGRPALPATDVSDREFFKQAQTIGSDGLYVSAPIKSRISGEWSLLFSKRVSNSAGEFLGVVSGVLELKTLEASFSRIKLGEHGSIWMARRDGVILARYPRFETAIGKTVKAVGPLGQVFYSRSDGEVLHLSPTDGRLRIAAVHHVEEFPIAIVVTAATEDVLAEWRGQFISLVLGGVGGIAALSLLALILANSTEELARTRSELHFSHEREEAQGRFVAAIGNMRQGLAMFDGHGDLIVCNQQYADLYKLTPELTIAGTSRESLHAHRRRVLTYPASRSQDCPRQRLNDLMDGRIILITEQNLKGGGFVSTHEDVTEQRRAEEKMLRLARRDALTDLPNRMVFKEALSRRIAALAVDERLAVHYLDLDGFKLVNDTLGHGAGDELLKKVAQRLADLVRSSDMLARLGGDEFAILQQISAPEEAEALAFRINTELRNPFEMHGQRIRIGSSVGISLALDDARDPDQLIKNADLALYAAKAAGRNTFSFFQPEMAEAMQGRLQLERELREALSTGQLELHYQPQVRLDDAQVVGFEALMRWRHPEKGLLAPGSFIALAEETGLINEFGEWAVKRACLDAARWPSHIRVAVNLSVVQLRSESLRSAVEEALALSKLAPERLELEVTESVMLKDVKANISALHALRNLGLKISMDDFGTGYSSLSGLRLFPFDKLKIDRSFVSDLSSREDCAAIVRSVANLANSLGMSTTAEGIETNGQWIQAKLAGCTEGQGYLFGAPVPADRISEILADRTVAYAERGSGLRLKLL